MKMQRHNTDIFTLHLKFGTQTFCFGPSHLPNHLLYFEGLSNVYESLVKLAIPSYEEQVWQIWIPNCVSFPFQIPFCYRHTVLVTYMDIKMCVPADHYWNYKNLVFEFLLGVFENLFYPVFDGWDNGLDKLFLLHNYFYRLTQNKIAYFSMYHFKILTTVKFKT